MSSVKRIAKNTGILFVSNIISKLFGFVYTIYMARYLGAQGFGILSFALAFTGMFGVLADMGLQPLTVREVARNTELSGKYLGNIAAIKSILGIITFVLIVLTINLMNYPAETVYVVYLIAFSVLINSFNGMFYSIYQGHEKMEYVGIGNIINSSLMFVGVFIAIYLGFNVEGFAYIYLISGIGVLLYNLIISTWKFVKPKIEIDLKFWKELLKEAWPFALIGFFVIIYFRIDSIMLSYMKGNEVVGYYSASYRLIDALSSLVPSIIYSVMFPVMSKYLNSINDLKKVWIKAFNLSFIVGITTSIFVVVFAKYIILIVYGYGYLPSVMVLQILIWAFFIICVSSITSGLLNATNKQRLVTFGAGAGAIINVILNIILIPKYSMEGAAIATVITEILMFVLYIYSACKFLKINKSEILSLFIFSKKDLYIIKELLKGKK
ncbi:flippase [Methanothermococcus okinawensis]|uniref:Polysaccharide biosynthesis protein n=1 Tax=Methanothermococcus okinawensis (strain DSM 14208 / JCM 11175 / IH1) TaxID=647113 RepID=F8AJS1_METOI|nr:flippase [Methanothermococcus okinawensis]AEH07269.1 polysaccharide biosynthesis protein [Methanothermococcus okinawensis IH1]